MAGVDVLHYCADVTEVRKYEVTAKEMNRTQITNQFLQYGTVQ
jgi:hypothetical protein